MAKPFDIVGYTYKADLYCQHCIIGSLPTGPGEAFDGWALADPTSMSEEANLTEIAIAFGIDRADETTFDSFEFPKVVLLDSVTWRDQCCVCGVYLDERN